MNAHNELKEKLLITGGSVDTIPKDKDKLISWATKLSVEAHELLMEKLRSSREFYKKILSEERRKKNPNSFRYEDAEKNIQRYNVQGKILKELLDTRK